MTSPDSTPMHIKLTDDRREALLATLKEFYAEHFDEQLSQFKADRIIDFFVAVLGPAVYNQAIQDARAFLFERLEDLDATFYEPDALDGLTG